MASSKDFVLLFPAGESIDQHRLHLLRLLHPHGESMLYAVYEDHLYELQKASPRRYASWFIDQNVVSDGSIYIANQVDPRFLILPYLQDTPKFSPISQLIYDHRSEDADLFPVNILKPWNLEEICDMNDKFGNDMILYRLNEDKCMNWLESKVERCAAKLRDIRLRRQGDHDTTFVVGFDASFQRSSAQTVQESQGSLSLCDTDRGEVLNRMMMGITRASDDYTSALNIIGDYISESWSSKLATRMASKIQVHSPVSVACQKRKADWEIALEIEKESGKAYSIVAPGSVEPSATQKVRFYLFIPIITCSLCAESKVCIGRQKIERYSCRYQEYCELFYEKIVPLFLAENCLKGLKCVGCGHSLALTR